MTLHIPTIPPINQETREKARKRQNSLTKPLGSLGYLETLSIDIAGMTGQELPNLSKKTIIVMAADHGIAREGVSPYPAEVTRQMALNFLKNGAAINVLARLSGSAVRIADVGVNADFGPMPGLIDRKIAYGTNNIAKVPAMTMAQTEQAIQAGMDIAAQEIADGAQLLAAGEMGIGNTTPSAAIAAILTGRDPEEVTGRGTGVDDAGLKRKIALIRQAIAVNQPNAQDPLDILSKIGGLEIAAMSGVYLAAASHGVPAVMDGLIATVSAALAERMAPGVKNYLIAGHQSEEIGHGVLLRMLDKRPLLSLNMRVGEGTGAALAFQIIDASLSLLREMATFDEAGVSDKA